MIGHTITVWVESDYGYCQITKLNRTDELSKLMHCFCQKEGWEEDYITFTCTRTGRIIIPTDTAQSLGLQPMERINVQCL